MHYNVSKSDLKYGKLVSSPLKSDFKYGKLVFSSLKSDFKYGKGVFSPLKSMITENPKMSSVRCLLNP